MRSELPFGWSVTTLGEVAEVVGGGTPSRNVARYWDGNIPWATPTDVTGLRGRYIRKTSSCISDLGLAKSSAKLLPAGSLLVTSRATIGACAINEVPMATNQGFQSLVPSDRSFPEFLFYLMSYHRHDLEQLAGGSTFREISKKSVGNFQLWLPPLVEQRKIAAILSAVDEAMEKTQAVIDQVQVVKKGLMQTLLTRGLPGRHTRFKHTAIGEIPEEWEVVPIEQCARNEANSFVIGPFGSNLVKSDYRESGVPVVFVRDIKPDSFQWKSDVYVSEAKARELSAHTVQKGDLVITKMGLPPAIAAIYPESMPPGIVTADIIRLRLDRNRAVPKVLCFLLNSKAIASQVREITAGQTRPKLTLRDYKKILVTLPSMEEQTQIADILYSLGERKSHEETCLSALSDLKTKS